VLDPLLAALLGDWRALFADELVGVYLSGSALAGGFDPTSSDLDLVVVTESEADALELAELDRVHRRFAERHPDWADRMDFVYVGRRTLAEFDSGGGTVATISHGDPFSVLPQRGWILTWYALQQANAVLLGPPVGELLRPIARPDFLRALQRHVVAQGEEPRPADLAAGSLAYRVLTLARALATFASGTDSTKDEGADYARSRYPAHQAVINEALRVRRAGGRSAFAEGLRDATAELLDQMAADLRAVDVDEVSARGPHSAESAFPSRLERLAEVDSTQRVVREWLDAGVPEVAVCVADRQTAGRGRQGRDWQAPAGTALLLSAGFRPPASVPPRHGWRLAATVALAMLDAAEAAAGLKDDTLWLKWPNDIVAAAGESTGAELRKVAGVLGEVAIAGERIGSAVVGIGVNVDWAASDFPLDLAPTMTSLRELAGGRPVDREQLLDEFLARLEPRYEALRGGQFDVAGWSRRQVTTGRQVEVALAGAVLRGQAIGVEPESGALLLEVGGEITPIDSGEVLRCRLA
jgi:BirA family biotin operon repressor/biotin-[acetyl-CoA-carboxylase] ligase